MILESDLATGAVRKHYIGVVNKLEILAHIAEASDATEPDGEDAVDLDRRMAVPLPSDDLCPLLHPSARPSAPPLRQDAAINKDEMQKNSPSSPRRYEMTSASAPLKTTLHDWGDDECVNTLKNCKQAILSRDGGGKVIIMDMVVGCGPSDIKHIETQVLFDFFILMVDGVERDEQEWKRIFFEAGFKDYRVTPVLGVLSIIEVYP
ncbi:hypothetical protein ACP4OV_012572 [Aristida adscensionis]